MQKVIASADVDIILTFEQVGTPFKLETGSSVTANITGSTDAIHAISHIDPIVIENGSTLYDISIQLQQAEAITIKDAIAAATTGTPDGSLVHMRQIQETLSVTIVYKKKKDVPATMTLESYKRCTGVEEGDTIERRSAETMKNWKFQGRGMERRTVPYA